MKAWKNYRCASSMGLLLAALFLWPACGYAVEISDRLTLSGFYNLDVSLSHGSDTILPTLSSNPITLKDGEATLDYSLIGLQADFSLTDTLRFAAQAVSSKQTDAGYAPTLEWAYANWDLGDDLFLRGGKLKTPLMQGIELRYVGFSRLWVRPLVPASGAAGFDDYLGVELVKQGRLGHYNLNFQGAYGVPDHHQDFVDGRDIKLLSSRIERDESWLNLSLMHARYDVSTKDLTRLLQKDAEIVMGSIEAEVLYEKAVVNFGYARSEAEINPDEQMAYLSLGYRLDRLTPYLLYQYRHMEYTAPPGPPSPPGPPPPPPPPGSGPKDGELTTKSISLGLRYDLDASHAIKAQIERQSVNDASYLARPAVKDLATIFSISFEGVF